MAPNEAESDFCCECGAPLSSFATLCPFECLFAEGFIYRQATERPRKFIVVLGLGLIFAPMGWMGGMLLCFSATTTAFGSPRGVAGFLVGVILIFSSIIIIAKCTRNYLARKKPSVDVGS